MAGLQITSSQPAERAPVQTACKGRTGPKSITVEEDQQPLR